MRRRNSLESRLCLLIVGLLFALLLAIGHVQLAGQRAALIQDRTESYDSLTRTLALMYMPIAKSDNSTLYREFTSRFMETDKDIAYVLITDQNGKVLFVNSRKIKPYQHKELIGTKTTRLMDFVSKLSTPGMNDPIKIILPTTVGKGERGKITIAFVSRSLDAAAEEFQANLLLTFATALILGLIGSMILAKTVVNPIKVLNDAAHKVGAGDLEVCVPITSNDELGDLSDSFNRMVAAMKENHDKLIERANTDGLTGLYNHRYFQDRLRSELRRADRYKRSLSMIMIDIDNFKSLNDTHGHPVGDSVLKDVATVLNSEARREIDVITRYGGEEFAIILPETEANEAMSVAERIRQSVQRSLFEGKEGNPIPVTISLGVSQYPIHSSEPEGLLMAADMAMYQSKSMGRNRTTLYSNDSRIDRESDPYKLYLLLHATDMSTIEAMAAAVDAKSQRYQGFSRDLMLHAMDVAKAFDLSDEELNDVRIASLLHDIGKLGIPDSVLSKCGELSQEELALLRSHPNLGYAIVQKSPHLKSMLPGILYHHEWWDGSGYPSGLKGEQIPLIARIIAVLDSYHAMLCDRPYTRAMTPLEAMYEVLRCSGTQFDPSVVDALMKVIENEESIEKAA